MAGLPLKRTTRRSSKRPELGVADIGEADEITVGLLDDEVVELLRRAQIGLRQHGELALLALDRPEGTSTFWRRSAELDVLRRKG